MMSADNVCLMARYWLS